MFQLPDKQVRLVHNPNAVIKNYMGKQNHDGAFMFSGATQSWVLPQLESGRFVNPFESDEERIFLENALTLNLDINKAVNDFSKIRVKIKKTESELEYLFLDLDCRIPLHYLWYLILRKQKDIAPSWGNRDESKMYRWILKEEGEEISVKYEDASEKMVAYNWLSSVKDSKIKMFNFLKVLGQRPPAGTEINALFVRLKDLIESDKRTLRTIVEQINDKDFDIKVFIEYAQLAKQLRKDGTSYRLVVGGGLGDVIGNTLQATIDYLKNPMNSEVKERIKGYVEIYKKEQGLK